MNDIEDFASDMDESLDLNLYDEEIVYPNCTVQILKNSQTGEESVGWWRNDT